MTLSAADIAGMRETIEADTLPDTCTIQTLSLVSDGAGGTTETYTNAATNVPCRVVSRVPQEMRQNDKLIGKLGYTVTLAYNRDVAPTSRIVWNGRTFEVIGQQLNTWQLHKRVVCVEIG